MFYIIIYLIPFGTIFLNKNVNKLKTTRIDYVVFVWPNFVACQTPQNSVKIKPY
jgi:hypothetical protein